MCSADALADASQPVSPTRPATGAAAADPDALLDAASQALFRLGRAFGRQPLHHLLAARTGHAVELSRILAVQAVEAAATEQPDQEVTVGTVADRLVIDPSTASRLVADTIQAGYLARAASPADGRRVRLEITAAGHALAEAARRHQRAVFDRLTHDWSDHDRQAFAHLFVRFAAAAIAAQTDPPATTPPQP